MQFTFGLCGPLALPPSKAVLSDECYSTGFLIGRWGRHHVATFSCWQQEQILLNLARMPKVLDPMTDANLCLVKRFLDKYYQHEKQEVHSIVHPQKVLTHSAWIDHFSREFFCVLCYTNAFMFVAMCVHFWGTVDFCAMTWYVKWCDVIVLWQFRIIVQSQVVPDADFVSRFASMFVVNHCPPHQMLQLSTISCFIVAIMVALEADKTAEVLYVCALLFGFAISWQYGAGYSWASAHLDVAVSTFAVSYWLFSSCENVKSLHAPAE